jgi:hypothetical protein
VGIESKEEHFFVEVPADMAAERWVAEVNRCLPEGLRLTGCHLHKAGMGSPHSQEHHYLITLKDSRFNGDDITAFNNSSSWVVEKVNRKGRSSRVDLKKLVTRMDMVSPTILAMTLNTAGSPQLPVVRILGEIFRLPERSIQLAKIEKQATTTG